MVVVHDAAGCECQPRDETNPRPAMTRMTRIDYSGMLI
jgi:hypothetical protein